MYIGNHGANIEYFAKKFNKKANDIIDFSSNINIFSPDINYDDILKSNLTNVDYESESKSTMRDEVE